MSDAQEETSMSEPTRDKLSMIAHAYKASKTIRTPLQAREAYITGEIEIEEYEAVLDRWNTYSRPPGDAAR